MSKHEHKWGQARPQSLELPHKWYWITGCECGAILMEPADQILHPLMEQMVVLERDRQLSTLWVIPGRR